MRDVPLRTLDAWTWQDPAGVTHEIFPSISRWVAMCWVTVGLGATKEPTIVTCLWCARHRDKARSALEKLRP